MVGVGTAILHIFIGGKHAGPVEIAPLKIDVAIVRCVGLVKRLLHVFV